MFGRRVECIRLSYRYFVYLTFIDSQYHSWLQISLQYKESRLTPPPVYTYFQFYVANVLQSFRRFRSTTSTIHPMSHRYLPTYIERSPTSHNNRSATSHTLISHQLNYPIIKDKFISFPLTYV